MKIVYVCLLGYRIITSVVHLLLSIVLVAVIAYSLLYTNSMTYDDCLDALR
jgi:hypothetical protein